MIRIRAMEIKANNDIEMKATIWALRAYYTFEEVMYMLWCNLLNALIIRLVAASGNKNNNENVERLTLATHQKS